MLAIFEKGFHIGKLEVKYWWIMLALVLGLCAFIFLSVRD